MSNLDETKKLKEMLLELHDAYECMLEKYEEVREMGKITTIYDFDKMVCIHFKDDDIFCADYELHLREQGWRRKPDADVHDDYEAVCDNPEQHLKHQCIRNTTWRYIENLREKE